jgi:molecular chaperone HtpG
MTATETAPQTMEFKTELKQLLDLIIHSLYTKKEIFLRELVSNAADAIDKVRFQALTDPAVAEGNTDWKIRLTVDEAAGTLTVSDNGIGMNRETVVDNLGTIAKSGTRAFMENLKATQAQDRPELIGQFGVGFYASFMVADKVTVVSRMAGGEGVRWESDGQGSFTVEPAEKGTRGTDVTLHLREDAKEFLKSYRLREVVRQYSNFIDHPVVIDVEREKDGVKSTEEDTLNVRKAIWLRNKAEIKPEEYDEFYKQLARDFQPPAQTVHVAAEGATEFRALMFIPQHKPMEWMMSAPPKSGLDLYVKRVLIQKECEELVPQYLRFVRGVVDSSDLPLNVSRETLQHNPVLAKIRSNVVNRVLRTLEEMKTGEYDKYLKVYGEFGELLKEGVGSDFSNRERLADLLLLESTATKAGEFTTLEKYVAEMKGEQKEIVYLIGESRSLIENSPYVEAYRARGEAVLLLTDPIDEYLVSHLSEYKGKRLKAADKGDAPAAEETPEQKAAAEKFKPLLEDLTKKLADAAKDVRLSHRLKESAACLVADEYAPTAHLERLMRRMGQGGDREPFKRTLELNPDHPVVQKLLALYTADGADPKVESYGRLLLDQALIAEGSAINDPAGFAKRVNGLMS